MISHFWPMLYIEATQAVQQIALFQVNMFTQERLDVFVVIKNKPNTIEISGVPHPEVLINSA